MTHWQFFLIATISLCMPPASAWGDVPVAAVLALHGEAELVSGQGKSRPAYVFGSVYEGEQLKVKMGGYAVLAFADARCQQRVDGPAEVACSSKGCKGPNIIVMSVAKKRPAQAADWVKGLTQDAHGGDIIRGRLPQLTPIANSTVPSTTPTLVWPAVAQASNYEVTVRKWRSPRILWRQTTAAVNLADGATNELKPGVWYEWTVIPADQTGQAMAGQLINGKFRVATKEDKEAADALEPLVRSGTPGELALAALGYKQMGMTAEAIGAYDRLVKQQAGEPAVLKALGDLYAFAGRDADARKQWDQAIAIYSKLSNQAPGEATLHAALSNLYDCVGRTEDSLRENRKAQELGSHRADPTKAGKD